jgi:hypothetical protein
MSWIDAFVWTCAIETPVYVLLLRRSFRDWWAPVVVSVLLQLATHPLLWFVFPTEGDYWSAFFVLETTVSLVEGGLVALLLWRLREPHALVRGIGAGILANASSAAMGLLL